MDLINECLVMIFKVFKMVESLLLMVVIEFMLFIRANVESFVIISLKFCELLFVMVIFKICCVFVLSVIFNLEIYLVLVLFKVELNLMCCIDEVIGNVLAISGESECMLFVFVN